MDGSLKALTQPHVSDYLLSPEKLPGEFESALYRIAPTFGSLKKLSFLLLLFLAFNCIRFSIY
jgi:hypothetical protein